MGTQAMIRAQEATMSDNVPVGWLTTEEVAELALCSARTVVRAIHIHQINSVQRMSGGTWLINRDEGVAWAHSYQQLQEQQG